MRVCDAAVLVLRETGNPAVMWGDVGLLHAIARRARMRTMDRAWVTERAVLGALSMQPGELVAALTREPHGKVVRIFFLPECAPARTKTGQAHDGR
jgi:hypothetical protein